MCSAFRWGLERRGVAVALSLAVLLGSCAAGSPGDPKGSGAVEGLVSIGAGLKGPAGLHAAVYASGLVHASAFALDARGRLWVSTSDVTDHRRDGVFLISSAAAAPVKVISGIRGPLGLLWLGRTLYVASIGRVEAFDALRGTRFARRRSVLRDPVARAWNNNLVLAPNGRLVMSISTSCDDCTPPSSWLAAIVTFRTDGSDLRRYAGGIRDGFGLAYFPGTNELFVSMNQRDDLGDATPGDWLGIVRKGQDWGFPACYGQRGVSCRGVPKPLAVLDAHAAAGGVAIVTGQLGDVVGTSALISEWSFGKVQRVGLTASGSGRDGTVESFLTGMTNPLPMIVTDAGSLLVGDWSTGTIYAITAG
jgi:glucose/arabinose dehydrogenase